MLRLTSRRARSKKLPAKLERTCAANICSQESFTSAASHIHMYTYTALSCHFVRPRVFTRIVAEEEEEVGSSRKKNERKTVNNNLEIPDLFKIVEFRSRS